MKNIIRTIAAGILGAVLGGFLGVFGVLLVATLLYGSKLEQGALIVFFTGPLGAVVGFIAGVLLGALSKPRS